MYFANDGRLRLALLGDVIPTRGLQLFREPEFLRLRELLRTADACFANFDSNVNHPHELPFAQGGRGGSAYVTTDPRLLADLAWMGIDLMAVGGSHATDYGVAGVHRSLEHLRYSGISHAGLGRNLAEARAPAYLDTAHGRVALIAATGPPNKPLARAGEQRPDAAGHAGINGVRTRRTHVVDVETLEQLRALGARVGVEAEKQRKAELGSPIPVDSETVYHFLGTRFEVGERPTIRTQANESDIEANLAQVRAARRQADKVLVSYHSQEVDGAASLTASRRSDIETPTEVLRDFAHRAIDAGADVFVGHGPHVPLGVEVYRGRPIFHSMGTFIQQLETTPTLPHEAYERFGLSASATPSDFVAARYDEGRRGHPADPLVWEQFVAVCDLDADGFAEVRCHPIELGFKGPASQRGRPVLARPEAAKRVLDRLSRLSALHGVEVAIKDGVGVIRATG
jgi:poly-gamma-glutamate capsule biosynthesis protein CapA/YwtB (metallophosphatase superfamily)